MNPLRATRSIRILVLAGFMLSLGVAIASSLLAPASLQLVCTAAGAKLIDSTGDDGEARRSAAGECPLCASAAAPPPTSTIRFGKPSPLAHALQPIAAAHIASATAPPLPSRGPPSALL